jgi:hypothetical protein
MEENRHRIQRRSDARAVDELHLELRILAEESRTLRKSRPRELGEPFDVSGAPGELVDRMLRRLGHR